MLLQKNNTEITYRDLEETWSQERVEVLSFVEHDEREDGRGERELHNRGVCGDVEQVRRAI